MPERDRIASTSIRKWPFEIRVGLISTFCEVWTHTIAFLEGNSKIRLRQPVDYRSCIILISHELHTENGGGDRPRKVKFAKFQKPRDLDLELGSSQSHICMHITCRTTGLPNRVTLSSSSTEIWPFEIRVMSTFREVWTHVITFLKENSKIELRLGPVFTIRFDLHAKMAEEIDL